MSTERVGQVKLGGSPAGCIHIVAARLGCKSTMHGWDWVGQFLIVLSAWTKAQARFFIQNDKLEAGKACSHATLTLALVLRLELRTIH